MAKNQVTLTFAGDSTDLERTFEKVGAGAKQVETKTTSAIDKIGDASTRAGRTARGLQGALGGLVASGQGVRAMMEGDILGGLLMLEGGFGRTALSAAKLARNIAQTAISFVASSARMVASMATTVATTVAGWVTMGIQAMVNAAKMAVAWLISLGPIGLVIAAVGAVIAILVALGVGFDDLKRWAETAWNFILDLIKGVWNWVQTNWPLLLAILTGPIGLAVLAIQQHWDTIKNAFTAVKDWIVARWEDLIGFVAGLPGRFAAVAAGIWGWITSGISAAIGWAIERINDLIRAFNRLPGGDIATIGGGKTGVIVRHHTGTSFFQPPAGQIEGWAMLRKGERVSSGGGGGVTVIVQGSVISERQLLGIVRDELKRGGFR